MVLAIEAVGSKVLLKRIHKSIDEHNARKGNNYELSISIGIAEYDPESPCTIEELLEKADDMMYKKKQERKKSLGKKVR